MSRLKTIKRGRQLLPPRILIYGTEKIGKTTWAASAPAPIFLPTEDGLTSVDADHFPQASSLADVNACLLELETQEHDYQTLVIDSVSALERLIHDEVCAESGVTSIEKAGGGYGRGYSFALNHWREVLAQLDRLRASGMAVILIGHNKVEEFSDPETAIYSRYLPRLHKTASQIICEWCDAVLFATKRTRTEADKSKDGRQIAKGSERVLRTTGSPACIAGNRYGIQEDLPLDWAAFVQAMGGSN